MLPVPFVFLLSLQGYAPWTKTFESMCKNKSSLRDFWGGGCLVTVAQILIQKNGNEIGIAANN